MDKKRAKRKVKMGIVLSNKMQKTVIIGVERTTQHPFYKKIIKIRKKLYAHTKEPLQIGDRVRMIETRPLSKLKRWLVVEKVGQG